jgi:hypothetical protein
LEHLLTSRNFSFLRQVAEAFSKEDIKTATMILIKMKYYNSIDNRLKKLKHDLGIVE